MPFIKAVTAARERRDGYRHGHQLCRRRRRRCAAVALIDGWLKSVRSSPTATQSS